MTLAGASNHNKIILNKSPCLQRFKRTEVPCIAAYIRNEVPRCWITPVDNRPIMLTLPTENFLFCLDVGFHGSVFLQMVRCNVGDNTNVWRTTKTVQLKTGK